MASATTKSSLSQKRPVPASWLKWAIALTASLGAMLEVIDTSIVNVALTDMQASVGATISEIGWVVTGYAIANVIIIPLTAWLGEAFGKKRYFVFSLVGFVVASVLCGLAANLSALVASRVLQGLLGGGLLAKAQSILFETFPPEEQGVAQAVFGVGVIAGPAIGPTLGGYLTDALGWRWIFFINVPVGIVAVLMAVIFLPADDLRPDRPIPRVDWWGIALLTIALGSLQTFLEEGEQDGWFESHTITLLAVSAIVGLLLFIWRELSTDQPAVDLRVLRHRSLAAGSVYSAVVGMGLYGTLFVIPIYAQTVLNYTAQQTGLLIMPGALASAVTMVVMGKVSGKVDGRVLIAGGSIFIAVIMFNLADLNPNTGSDALFWPLLWRGVSVVMMFLPLSLVTLGPLPKQDIPAGSGFYNLTRQLGGSIGIALLATVLDRRHAFHRAVLVEHVSPYDLQTQERINALMGAMQSQGADAATAHQQALALLDQTLEGQAMLLAFEDLFWVVGLIFLVTLPLLFLLGKGGDRSVSVGGH
ncbi:DHA2 family efflux MFS transporter permease subunit [Geitlerinema sp. PCC 7407]|uniref:DHA2 family efflux MFS transporter permease subunit n=1 Tax=Geitlerinema sp. PCC 7407 TaxID=1173025 RepID=UPI00029F8A84|nr:DHA2 family efflux MFS transporter permease subunit [Geitlerinema sp. PCC 7407]AFY65805.1 drug resistance transporter, EmrB/QacA subfamily [Geitlerinema sp. PCC 7407]